MPVGRGEPKERWVNPFLPYDDALWVTHLSDTHTLLLNKFNIVPHHVLVVTRAFEQQSDLLKLEDFEAAWQVLQVCLHKFKIWNALCPG